MRTLLVEGDMTVARGLLSLFRSSGVVADHADEAAEAFELLRHYEYDVVVTGTPSGAQVGIDLVRRIRAAKISTPIVLLSSDDDAPMRVRALAAGADDVVRRPFDPMELLARMQAIVRRSKGFAEASLKVGPLVVRQDSREVSVDGREVRLTGKEYAILELLVLRRGMVLTKDAFLNHIYGGMDEPEAKIIDVFICKLRKRLGLAGGGSLITTVWGRGYMLKEPSDFAFGRSVAASATALSAA